jgi:4-amino-4-deoxy-L-arabinose transferase-like glycosyltransferase
VSLPPSLQRWLAGPWAAALLLALHFLIAVLGARRESPTYDEPDTLIGGYTIWTKGDYRLFPDGGRLPQLWATLPLLAMDLRYAPAGEAWRASSAHPVVHEFLWGSGNDARAVLRWSRAMIALLSVALGACVWWWSRRLFGPWAASLSLTLYAFSPTMLAHGRLVTSDVAGALFLLLASAGMWAVLQRVNARTVALSTLATAGMALAKQSVPLLAPIGLALLGLRLLDARPLPLGRAREVAGRGRLIALFAAVALLELAATVLAIWAVHGFRFTPFAGDAVGAHLFWPWDFLTNTGTSGDVIAWMREMRLLPEAYIYGQAVTLKHAAMRFAFLRGEYSDTGWWWFFPYAFAVKTPLGTLLLAALGACALPRRALRAAAPLLVLFWVYWLVAIFTRLNIGHRHLLPTYAPLFVVAGAAVTFARGRLVRWLLILAALSTVFEALRVFPHHLSYFNPLAGGPANGYRHLVDSSLDWGQDLPALENWCKARAAAGDARPVWLSFSGPYDPRHELPAVRPLDVQWLANQPPEDLRAGHYAISATNLQAVRGALRGRWTEAHEQRWRAIAGLVARHDKGEARATWDAIRAEIGDTQAGAALAEWRGMRLLRLCAFLRGREPDARAGYSIPIFTLGDDELRRALEDPIAPGS